MSHVIALLAAFLFLAPPSVAPAQSPAVWSLAGRVTDATGLPLVGAQISVTASATIYRPEAGRVIRGGFTWRWERAR